MFIMEPKSHDVESDTCCASTPTLHSNVGPPPNGGVQAWCAVAGGHIVTFFVWGLVNSFGMFQDYYTHSVQPPLSSPSNVAWIGSIAVFLLMFVPLISGSLSDIGYYKTVLRVGILIYLVGVFATSVCKTYWQFVLAQGICVGIADGFMFVPSMSVVSTYFDSSRRSFAIGIILCGSATGGMVFPIMLNRLFEEVGFGWAVRIFGFLALVLLVLAERLLKTRLPPKDSPKIFEFGELKDLVFLLFIVGSFLNFCGLYFAFFFINAYARTKLGLNLRETIPILMVLNGIGVPGRLLANWAADRFFRPIHVQLPINLLIVILLFVWISIDSVTSMYVFAVFYGIPGAAIQSLFPATLADLTLDPKKTGTRLGMGFAISSFGVLIGSPVGGVLVQVGNGSYLYAQAFAGGCTTLGFFLVLAAAVVHRRRLKRV
ncbi:major facilitator superfamily transporter [Polyplosphaeria fusca]|uniref:Major facilitator superfamily transporter n=1 Tax=Polyplosphaeria fusca TaxID=682080 RepID=A0A9P4UWP2_9PLEO|nr:major facilitator superfamily transporter [Polyplosphaeria fusca]